MAAHASIGMIVPTSLLACITVTRTVLGVIARLRSSGSMRPAASTGRAVTRAPERARNSHGATMAGCSTRVVMMCGDSTSPALAKNTPFSAKLFDSLPPLVNTTSAGSHPSSPATRTLACSTCALAGAPAQWRLEGFPNDASSMTSRIFAATLGASGVLAL